MGNCLKTQLKESVNNENLVYYGSFVVDLHGDSQVYFGDMECHVKVVGDGYLCSDDSFSDNIGTEITANNVYVKTNGCKLIVIDNYEIHMLTSTLFTPASANIEQFKYRSNIRELALPSSYCYGDISGLSSLSNLTRLEVEHSSLVTGEINFSNFVNIEIINLMVLPNVSGSIDTIANLSKIHTLYLFQNGNFIGNIENLHNNINLLTAYLGGNIGITGRLETLAEALLSKGKTTQLVIGIQGTSATFNNQVPIGNFNYKLTFGTNSIIVGDRDNDNVYGTFNGSTWTYNN